MRDIVLTHLPRDRHIRLLDIGAGTGSLVFRLADALPDADVTGIDISAANVRAAVAQQAARTEGGRAHFEAANYLEYAAGPFDAIVADGVLHLIPGDTSSLIRKLARDVRPGGLLICSMPFDCVYNRAMTLARRMLRAMRSPGLDDLMVRAGHLLHGHEMDDAGLRERIIYMYLAPERVMSGLLIAAFAEAGLHRVAEYPMRSVSLSQLRHRVTVFARDAR
jgi:SAM-dependent methyltransferase